MRAKWLPLVELMPLMVEGFVECSPTPELLCCYDLPFELPVINPECTTVIELLLGAPPREAGPTLLV